MDWQKNRFEYQSESLWYLAHAKENATKICLFLHGFPDSPLVWSSLASCFPDYFLIAPYAPRVHNESYQAKTSSLRGQEFNRQRVARQIIQLLKTMPALPVTIIAHDLGGVIAHTLASIQPQLVERIFFINTLPLSTFIGRWKRPEQWLRSSYMALFFPPYLAEKLLALKPELWQQMMYQLGGISGQQIRQLEPSTCGLNALPYYRQHLLDTIEEFTQNSFQRQPLSIPMHFIWGENEPFIILPNADELTLLSEKTDCQKILGAGHWPQVSHSEALSKLILKQIT